MQLGNLNRTNDVVESSGSMTTADEILNQNGLNKVEALVAESSIINGTNPAIIIFQGQSNMGTSGMVAPYPELGVIDNAYRAYYSEGNFANGVVRWDNDENIGWGPELQLCQRWSDTLGRDVITVKYKVSGLSLDSFLPGSSWTDADTGGRTVTEYIADAVAYAQTIYPDAEVVANVLAQGESGGGTGYETVEDYKAGEIELRDHYRGLYGDNMLHITYGLGGDYPADAYPTVAKQQIDAEDALSRYVDMAGTTTVDGTHYDPDSLIAMGNKGFEALFKEAKPYSQSASDGIVSYDDIRTVRGDFIMADGYPINVDIVSQEGLQWYMDTQRKEMADLWVDNVVPAGDYGTMSWEVNDLIGGSMMFDGVKSISIPAVSNNSEFTVAGRFYVESSTGATRYFFEDGGNQFRINVAGTNVSIRGGNDGGLLNNFATIQNQSDAFVAVSHAWDGGTATWTVQIDGQTTVITQGVAGTFSGTMEVGASVGTNPMLGNIGACCYFDRALSADELVVLRNRMMTDRFGVRGVQ